MPSKNGAGGTAPSNPPDGDTGSAGSTQWRDAFDRVQTGSLERNSRSASLCHPVRPFESA